MTIGEGIRLTTLNGARIFAHAITQAVLDGQFARKDTLPPPPKPEASPQACAYWLASINGWMKDLTEDERRALEAVEFLI